MRGIGEEEEIDDIINDNLGDFSHRPPLFGTAKSLVPAEDPGKSISFPSDFIPLERI